MRRGDSSISWDLEPWATIKVPYDEDFVAAFKANIHIRAFDPGTKCWSVPARYVPIVQRLAKKFMELDLSVGAVPTTMRVAAAPVAKSVPEEYEILCVLPGSPIEVVRASYKALAFMRHPDRGGNAEHFRILTAAYEKVCNQ